MKKYDIFKTINAKKKVCLIAHVEPDTDALCSMIVMREFLMAKFGIKTIDIFAECDAVAEQDLPVLDKVTINKLPKKYDVAIMMDSPSVARVGEYGELFSSAKQTIVIDHHTTNTMCGDVNIVENVSSTCEIVFKIVKSFKFKLNKGQLGRLYAGVIADTNNLTVGQMTPTTFSLIAQAVKVVDIKRIYNNYFLTNSLKSAQLYALAVQNLVSLDAGRILITHITHEQAENYKARHENYTGISNRLCAIKESKMICFIHPRGNEYYASMRCKEGYDVSKIAKKFGGGGHTCAAAYNSTKTLKELEKEILQEFTAQLETVKEQKISIF